MIFLKRLIYNTIALSIVLCSCTGSNKTAPLNYSIEARNKEVRLSANLVDKLLREHKFKSADSIYDKLANEYADSADIYFIRLRQIDTKLFTYKLNEAKELVNFCFIQNKVPGSPKRSLIYYHQYMATIDRKMGDLCASMKQLDSLVEYSKSNRQILDTGMVILKYQFIIDDKHIDSALIAKQSISSMANLVRHRISCE